MSPWYLFFFLSAHLTITFSANAANDNTTRYGDDVDFTTVCPTWYTPDANNSAKCSCGETFDGKLRCQQDEQIGMVVGNCMTQTENQTLIGLCPYTVHNVDLIQSLYTTMPKNISKLEYFMCGHMNRTGVLCSQCKPGLHLAVLSYQRECIECSNTARGVALFLFLAFVPTTVFFFIVMSCKIDISSGPMNAILCLLQVILSQVNQNPTDYIFRSQDPLSYYPVLVLLTVYGIWNLDYFRFVIPPFCISPSLTSLPAQTLEYVIAIYPLVLVVATYICVELYDNGNYLVVRAWLPFRRLFDYQCFRDLNIKHSLITTFATFLLLAYTRLSFISKSILNYTLLKNSRGETVDTVMAMDASISYLSRPHIPYVILAVFMVAIFNLLPFLLLLFYPTKWFQQLLGCFPHVNWHPLHAFMDIFQGCYKNGTNGTRDYRYFAAFYILLRLLILIPIDDHSISAIRLVFIPLLYSFLLAVLKPYQNNIYNIWDTFCFFVYTLNQLWLLCSTYDSHLPLEIVYVTFMVVVIYSCSISAVKIFKTVCPNYYALCVVKILRNGSKCGWNKYTLCNRQREEEYLNLERGERNNSNSLQLNDGYPDRLVNPQDYRPLLAENSANKGHNMISSYGVQ